jgi:hypothetical protein
MRTGQDGQPLSIASSPKTFYFLGLISMGIAMQFPKCIHWYHSFPVLLLVLAGISIYRKSIGMFVYGALGLMTPLLLGAAILFLMFRQMDNFN